MWSLNTVDIIGRVFMRVWVSEKYRAPKKGVVVAVATTEHVNTCDGT